MRKSAALMVLILLFVGATLVAADTNALPGSGWTSGQQVQNIGDSNTTIVLTAYNQDGDSYDCGSQTLPSGGSYTYLPDSDCLTMPAGFLGSAVVSADGPIAAVVNVNNKPANGAASGQYTGTSGNDVTTTLNFPLAKSDHSGRTTTFYIQNASSNSNNITATFLINGVTYNKTFSNVPPNAMVVLTPADAGVPTGTGNFGGLTVSGSQPLAGSSLEYPTSETLPANLQASRGFTPGDYDTDLYCPLLRNAHGNKSVTSGLQVQNVGNTTENIRVTYTLVSDGSTVGPISVNNVAPGASANFLQANDLEPGDLASAVVTTQSGNGLLAAVVNEKASASDPQRLTTYACFSGSLATATISMPLVKEDFGGSVVNTTGVQVQNVGSSATTVTLTYSWSDASGSNSGVVSFTHTDSIAPGASKTFYRVANGGTTNLNVLSGSLSTLNKTNSGVVISSNNGQPVVAIANESSLTGSLQDTKNYEGFNLAD